MEVDMIVDKHAKSKSSKTEFKKITLKGSTAEGLELQLVIMSTADVENTVLEHQFPLDAVLTMSLVEGKQKRLLIDKHEKKTEK
jgi:hypothetical protein